MSFDRLRMSGREATGSGRARVEKKWRRERDSNPRGPGKTLHAFQACLFGHSSTSPSYVMAERVGFEPTVPVKILRFSRATP